MRITGGTLLGRTLKAPQGTATRPTSDRVREALFNILAHHDWGEAYPDPLDNAMVLDAFGGTGALAFECLSRGSASATVFDLDSEALKAASANVETLRLGEVCKIKRANALAPPPAPAPCSLIFLDPPYRKNLIVPAIKALVAAGWIVRGSLLVIETAKGETSEPLEEITLLHDRTYGDTSLYFARYLPDETNKEAEKEPLLMLE